MFLSSISLRKKKKKLYCKISIIESNIPKHMTMSQLFRHYDMNILVSQITMVPNFL